MRHPYVSGHGRARPSARAPIAHSVFGGIQTGFAFMQVYGHLNIGLNDSVGGHLGARLAF